MQKKKHKNLLKLSKKYNGANSKKFKCAKQTKIKSLFYSYISRRKRKRTYKKLWIKKINKNINVKIINYSDLKKKMKEKNIILNQKILYLLNNFDKNNFFFTTIKN